MSKMISKYFSVKKMACRCGCGVGRDVADYDPILLVTIDAFRTHMDGPIYETSGARCPSHNKASDGYIRSPHIVDGTHQCQALDFWVGNDGVYRSQCLSYAYVNDFTIWGIGIGGNFLHFDVKPRPRRRVWPY